jgi:hypothetical protein
LTSYFRLVLKAQLAGQQIEAPQPVDETKRQRFNRPPEIPPQLLSDKVKRFKQIPSAHSDREKSLDYGSESSFADSFKDFELHANEWIRSNNLKDLSDVECTSLEEEINIASKKFPNVRFEKVRF